MEDTSAMTKPNVKIFFAGFGIRMAGVALDFLIVAFLAGGVNDYIFIISLTTTENPLIPLAVLLLYFSAFWSSPMKATPAQLLFGMRVVNKAGEGLDLRHAVVRSVSLTVLIAAAMALLVNPFNPYFVVVALVSYALLFLAALTPNRQAGHDLLAHSLVVNKIALESSECRSQLFEHVSDNDPVSSKQRRPSILSTVGNALVLGVTVFFILIAAMTPIDMKVRAQVTEAIGITSGYKTALAEYYAETQDFTGLSISDLQGDTTGKYVDSVTIAKASKGTIVLVATFNQTAAHSGIKGKEYRLATENGGNTWACGLGIQNPLLRGDNQVQSKYLPGACK